MQQLHFVFFILLMILNACVSSSKYQHLNAETEHLRIHLDSLKKEYAAVVLKSEALDQTREQLRKTEQTLIQFYMKYEGRLPEHRDDSLLVNDRDNAIETRYQKLKSEFLALEKKWNLYQDSIEHIQNLKQEPPARIRKEEFTRLQQQYKSLLAEKKSLQVQFNEIQVRNEELKDSIEKLRGEHRLAVEGQATLLNKQKMWMWQMDSLQMLLQKNKVTSRDSLQHLSEEQARELEQWKSQHTQLLEKTEYLNTLLSKSKEELQQLREERKTQQVDPAQLNKLEEELQTRDRNLMALNEAIEAKNEEITSLKNQLQEANAKQLNLESQIDIKQKEQEKLQIAFQDLNIAKASLERTIKVRDQSLEHQEQESQLRTELHSKEDQLAALNAKYSKLEESFQQSEKMRVTKNGAIDSLQESYLAQSNKLAFMQTQLKAIETELIRVKKDLAEKKDQNIDLIKRNVALRQLQDQLQEKLDGEHQKKPSSGGSKSNALTEAFVRKLENIKAGTKGAACIPEMDHSKVYFYLNQNALFETESLVMKQEGTNVISLLAAAYKMDPHLKIHISAFLRPNTGSKANTDQLIRHASTVYKLLNALGIQASQMTLGVKQYPMHREQVDFIQGIEFMLYEE